VLAEHPILRPGLARRPSSTANAEQAYDAIASEVRTGDTVNIPVEVYAS